MDNMVEIRPGRLINIAVYDNPNSLGTIFMIHGLGGRGAQWREQIKVLQKNYTLIVPDLLGHGKSAKPRPTHNNPYEFMEFVLDLECIFKNYAGKQNIVMGHSYGGALAAYLCVSHLQTVQKLILLAPITCEPKTQIPFIYKLPNFIFEWCRPYLEKKFRAAAFNSHTTLDLLTAEAQEDKKNEMVVVKAMVLGLQHMPFLSALQITIPTLIIFGETDKIISMIKATAFYEQLPQRKFALVENAGHMMMLEQPGATNTLIISDLA